MTLKEQIIADLTEAMKAKEELKLSTLRMLKAAIMNYEVSGADMEATDEVVVDLVKKGIKALRNQGQRHSGVEFFQLRMPQSRVGTAHF